MATKKTEIKPANSFMMEYYESSHSKQFGILKTSKEYLFGLLENHTSLTIDLLNYFTSASAQQFLSYINGWAIDLTSVDEIESRPSSAAIQSILVYNRLTRNLGYTKNIGVILSTEQKNIRNLFEQTQLDRVLSVHESIDDYINARM